MIHALREPLETVSGVQRYVGKQSYADSFGYEWTRYSRTYSDAALGVNVSLSRLEYVLGFPLEFLREKTVLEVGCGAGRFTEYLVKSAGQVVAADLSEAVYVNAALGAENLLPIQASLYDMPEFSDPVDVVFCRGVIQHTPDPKKSIRTLFTLVRPGGLVIFDVYRKNQGGKGNWRRFAYFWRPVVQRIWTVQDFDRFITRHDEFLFRWHHRMFRFWNSWRPLRRIIAQTPFYFHVHYGHQYPQMNHTQHVEVFKNELVDMFYAHFDQPMTAGEILAVLGEIGQRPYSYDLERNIFRCKNEPAGRPLKLFVTKNGIAEKTA